jgi:hypothetical protein
MPMPQAGLRKHCILMRRPPFRWSQRGRWKPLARARELPGFVLFQHITAYFEAHLAKSRSNPFKGFGVKFKGFAKTFKEFGVKFEGHVVTGKGRGATFKGFVETFKGLKENGKGFSVTFKAFIATGKGLAVTFKGCRPTFKRKRRIETS